ncbi:hypothetical protein [Kocuria rosea]|uniref:phage tail tube protein n=1 Tax=Kocuria rosea TaxID=1275 RepID=UPI003D329C5B
MANEVINFAADKGTTYGGGLLDAPTTTAAPTDADTALDPAFKPISLIGDSGLADSVERSTDDVRDINGDIVLTVQTEYGVKVTFTILERSLQALKAVYGQGNVTETTTTGVTTRVTKYNAEELDHRSYVAQLKGRNGRKLRKYYPDGQITEISETTYAKNAPSTYEVTMTAYPDENGNCVYDYESFPAVV